NGGAYADLVSAGVWATSGTAIYNSNAGNVGIGVTNPLSRMHVVDDQNNEAGVIVENTNSGANAYASIEFKTDAGRRGFLHAGSSATGFPYTNRLTLEGTSSSGVNIVASN